MGSIAPVEVAEAQGPASPWPYAKMPERKIGEGDWALWMGRGGAMTIYPSKDGSPHKFHMIKVYEANRGELERFLVTFCAQGWEKDENFKHQDGTVWLFNWRSFTLAQIYVASQVACLFVASANAEPHQESQALYDQAWTVGRAFGDQIDAAVTTYYREAQTA